MYQKKRDALDSFSKTVIIFWWQQWDKNNNFLESYASFIIVCVSSC